MSGIIRFLRKPFANILIAVLIGFALAAVIVAIAGYNPFETFATLIYGAFGKPKYITNVIIKATPILLTGVAVSFAFQTGLFNIGRRASTYWVPSSPPSWESPVTFPPPSRYRSSCCRGRWVVRCWVPSSGSSRPILVFMR